MLLPPHAFAGGHISFVCHDVNDNFTQVFENWLVTVTLIYSVN
jgi:hypothetical protein